MSRLSQRIKCAIPATGKPVGSNRSRIHCSMVYCGFARLVTFRHFEDSLNTFRDKRQPANQ